MNDSALGHGARRHHLNLLRARVFLLLLLALLLSSLLLKRLLLFCPALLLLLLLPLSLLLRGRKGNVGNRTAPPTTR